MARDFTAKWIGKAALDSSAIANSWQWLVGLPIAALILWWLEDNDVKIKAITSSGVLEAFFVALAAFIVTLVFIFAIRFFRTPGALYADLEAENERLKKVIHDREARQQAIDTLWGLRSEGIVLRNEFPATADVYRAWQPRYLAWRKKVLIAAGFINPNLEQWLARLDILREEAIKIAPQETKDVQNMTEILARMGEYLKREIDRTPSVYD
jgi:hypothetical protein